MKALVLAALASGFVACTDPLAEGLPSNPEVLRREGAISSAYVQDPTNVRQLDFFQRRNGSLPFATRDMGGNGDG